MLVPIFISYFFYLFLTVIEKIENWNVQLLLKQRCLKEMNKRLLETEFKMAECLQKIIE